MWNQFNYPFAMELLTKWKNALCSPDKLTAGMCHILT